jgi:hypothetical protein
MERIDSKNWQAHFIEPQPFFFEVDDPISQQAL